MSKHGMAIGAATLTLAASASAQVDKVTLRFDGLACPFCVYNVEKQVKKIAGVDRGTPVENDLKRGLIWFEWDPARAFVPEEVRNAAGRSGFTLRELRVSAEGRIRPPTDDSTNALPLMDPETHRELRLAPDARADRREAWDALVAHAADADKAVAVRVHGAVAGEGSSWRTVLHGWSPVEYGAVVDAEVEGFACERCAARTMTALRALDDVIHAQAHHETGRVLVWTTSEAPDVARIGEGIERLGFTLKHVHAHKHEQEQGDGHAPDQEDGG